MQVEDVNASKAPQNERSHCFLMIRLMKSAFAEEIDELINLLSNYITDYLFVPLITRKEIRGCLKTKKMYICHAIIIDHLKFSMAFGISFLVIVIGH